MAENTDWARTLPSYVRFVLDGLTNQYLVNGYSLLDAQYFAFLEGANIKPGQTLRETMEIDERISC